MTRLALAFALVSLMGSCSKDEGGSFFPPSVLLRLSLPADLAPQAADCLELALTAPTGKPPSTAAAFGLSPFRIQPSGLHTTLIQFLDGSNPFVSSSTDIELQAGAGTGTDQQATFVVAATVRRADGVGYPDDPCNGGTVLAQGTAQLDTSGQPIRFPTKGRTTVDLPLVCVLPGGCAAVGDGGTTRPDAGVFDGGPVDGGT
jgi:hypothetical protein